MLKNKKTGAAHTASISALVGAVCFLLAQFNIVPPEKFTAEAVSAIVTVASVLAMFWRQYIRP